MTPEEFERALWATWKHRENQLRDDMRNAWYIANLMRQRNLPSLGVFLGPPAYDQEDIARRQAEHEQLMKEMG